MIKIHVAASQQYDVILNKGILSMTGMYVKDALGLQDDRRLLLRIWRCVK